MHLMLPPEWAISGLILVVGAYCVYSYAALAWREVSAPPAPFRRSPWLGI